MAPEPCEACNGTGVRTYKPKPISWYACPFCGVEAHSRCRQSGGRTYSMGYFHAARIAERQRVWMEALSIDGAHATTQDPVTLRVHDTDGDREARE